MDRLPCPSYALPGNHDSYPNEIWKSVMGCDRRYSFEIGGYGYSGQIVNGRYDFNVFDPSWAWGYHILEIYNDKIKTYHVRTANQYVATNGTFSIEQTIEDEITLAIE